MKNKNKKNQYKKVQKSTKRQNAVHNLATLMVKQCGMAWLVWQHAARRLAEPTFLTCSVAYCSTSRKI
jgi:hypothetical protein